MIPVKQVSDEILIRFTVTLSSVNVMSLDLNLHHIKAVTPRPKKNLVAAP